MAESTSFDPPVDTIDNLVLLSVDSFRLDRLHAERNDTPLTPNLDRLSEQSIEFTEGIAPGPATPHSVASILTGAYPSQFPDMSLPKAGSKPFTLAEHLSERGFECAAFHQNNLISRRYNYDRGFDYYYDISEETRKESGRGEWRLRIRNLIEDTPLMSVARWLQTQLMENFGKSLYVLDEPGDSLTDRALEWLDDTGGKRFLWLHYMDTHHPYLSPSEIQAEFDDVIPRDRLLQISRKARSDATSLDAEEVESLKYAYDCSVRFVDQQIGRIVEYFAEREALDDLMIVITGDHGEELNEHGEFGHSNVLWDELITVPLMILYPRIGQRRVDGQAPVQSLVDTVLNGTGWFQMLNQGQEYVIAETREGTDGVRCCRGNGYKLIRDGDDRITTRIRDGEETVIDSDAVPSEILSELAQRLEETENTDTYTAEAVDEELLREDLQALGYLEED